jgi:D-alanyl-D-alanine carboxypeptidase
MTGAADTATAGICEAQLARSIDYIDSWLEYQYGNSRLPGLAIGVRHGDRMLLARGFGHADIDTGSPMTADHAFRIGSLSKMFTATGIYLLAERRALRLDDLVADHLSWFSSERDDAVRGVTIRQLLCHGSGLARDAEDASYWHPAGVFPTTDQLGTEITRTRLVLPAGQQFKYSNLGPAILGAVIEAVTGARYSDFITERIIRPLGLACTGTDLDEVSESRLATAYSPDYFGSGRVAYPHVPANALAAAGGFYSTVSDVCSFAAAHFLGNDTVLSDAAKRDMHKLQWHVLRQRDHGNGFVITRMRNRLLIGHGGIYGGFATAVWIDPADHIAVTVFGNSLDAQAQALAEGILAIIDFFQDPGLPASLGSPAPEDLRRFETRLFSVWDAVDIVVVRDWVVAVSPEHARPFDDPTILRAAAVDRLRIAHTSGYLSIGEDLSYTFRPDGGIASVEYAGVPYYLWDDYLRHGRG